MKKPRRRRQPSRGVADQQGVDVVDSTCAVDDCEDSATRRGWCESHYRRWRRHGDPLGGRPRVPRVDGTPEERFWPKVDQNGPTPEHAPELGPCWVWTTTAATTNGYPQFRVGRRMVLAYRFAYELLVGPIPEGLDLDHLCRNRQCVNPAHLEPVTLEENNARTTGTRYRSHCYNGKGPHLMTPENTYWYGPRMNKRACRACRAAWHRARRRRATR